MGHYGDPLKTLIAALPEDDLERTAQCISAAHRHMAAKALRNQDKRAADFHSACAGDVLKRLREATNDKG